MFLEFLAAENLKNTIPAPLCRGMGHRVPPIPSGNRVFGVFSCRKPQKHDSRPALSRDGASGPPRSVAGWGIGSRQFRVGKVFLEFLAAENLKNTIPAPLCRGMGHRVPPIPSGNRVFGVFSCRKPQKHDSRPALSLSRDGVPPIPSGNRVFGVYSCRKPQKHDSRPALSRVPPIPSGNRVFGVFSCRKPQKHDSRPALLQDGASGPPRSVAGWGIGSRQFRAKIVFLEFLAAENLKNTIPAPLCCGMGHRVPPIPSGNRVFGVFSCRKPQRHDSRPALSRDGASGPARIVFLEFLAAENLKNTIPAPLCRGMGHRVPPIPSQNRVFGVFSSNSERESCFWSF